jgi:hypothetical protein
VNITAATHRRHRHRPSGRVPSRPTDQAFWLLLAAVALARLAADRASVIGRGQR